MCSSDLPTTPDSDESARLLAAAWMERGPKPEDEQMLHRLAFAGHAVRLDDLVQTAVRSARSLSEVDLARALDPDVLRSLNRDAPMEVPVPSGRHVGLRYAAGGAVSAAVKLQELFGLADTPRIGTRREPLLLELLAPNGRPVQTTRDLRSFWNRTYPEVRRELRGRYPKHPWPEDPWKAQPTARATRRRK